MIYNTPSSSNHRMVFQSLHHHHQQLLLCYYLREMRFLTEDKADSGEIAYNHDDFDANRNKFTFKINGSRPSTPSSSPLRSVSPLLLLETLSRKSFSYGKLPLEPIRLTVLKLDGTSFDITAAKNPTVAQLKQAVEDAFNHLPKHGVGKVSWSHVWAQFCLCFDGQKLLDEQDCVRIQGLKDGDQLQFVRHTSISYNLVKERPVKRDYDLQQYKLRPSKQEVHTLKQVQEKEVEQANTNQHNKENKNEHEDDSSDDMDPVNITCQCSWGHLWKRLFSKKRHNTNYAGLATS